MPDYHRKRSGRAVHDIRLFQMPRSAKDCLDIQSVDATYTFPLPIEYKSPINRRSRYVELRARARPFAVLIPANSVCCQLRLHFSADTAYKHATDACEFAALLGTWKVPPSSTTPPVDSD